MKKRIKMIFCVLAIACIGSVCVKGIASYVNAARFKSLISKITQTAVDKKISLSMTSCEGLALNSSPKYDKYAAKDTLSKRIEENVWYGGWTLDTQDSIICGEHSIDYHGNVQGEYKLEGEEKDYLWNTDRYTAFKELSINEDGSRRRDYEPKDSEYLEQVKLTVQAAIEKTLTREEKAQYTDINISITSNPDFDYFIPKDYKFYVNSREYFKNEAKKYTLLFILYIVILTGFFMNTMGKQYIVKWIITVAAFILMIVLAKGSLRLFLVMGLYIVLVYVILRILTLNHFSRTFFFAVLGIILGLLLNKVYSNCHLYSFYIDFGTVLIDAKTWFIGAANIFMGLLFSLDNKILLDEYIERRK